MAWDATSRRNLMILCSCNVISDREVRAAVKPCGAAADRARDVFRGLGFTPKCGRCVRANSGPLRTRSRRGAQRRQQREPAAAEC